MADKQMSQQAIDKATTPTIYMLGYRGTYQTIPSDTARAALAGEHLRIVAVDLVHGIAYCEASNG